MASDCPQLGKGSEAPGRTKAQAYAVGATMEGISSDKLTGLTVDELEKVLANRKLHSLLSSTQSTTNVVQTTGTNNLAVGSTVSLEVRIEDVPVEAMVDTGAQSTIISRATLNAIGAHLKERGQPLPKLELPTVHLYGKDGRKGGRRLNVTAQLNLTFSMDGMCVTVPVFVQPDSEQACLLGMNVIPHLGIKLVRANGKPLIPTPSYLT